MEKRYLIIVFLLVFLLVFLFNALSLAYAHGEDEGDKDEPAYSADAFYPVKTSSAAWFGVTALFLFVIIALRSKKLENNSKKVLYFSIAAITSAITLYFIGTTLHINLISETKGPVHWHADFEIWNCGQLVDLADPKGMSNRIGSPVFHEHGDDRIHVEGVIVNKEDASLHNFFHLLGGALNNDFLSIPTNEGIIEMKNGGLCNGREAVLQVFVYRIKDPGAKDLVYEQIKLKNPEDYVLSPHPDVPPGDCIILEFDEEKDSTNKICDTYRIAIQKGELSGS